MRKCVVLSRADYIADLVIAGVVCLTLGTIIGIGISYQQVAATSDQVRAEHATRQWADLQRTTDFWRDQALECRTDGVDSLRPYPEVK